MYIKSDFKAVLFKPATNGQSDKGFLLTSKVCPQGIVCPCPGAIYIYNIIKNQISFFKLATNGQRDKGFLLTSTKFCPQGVVFPCPGLYTCIKSFKMCLKSNFKETVLKLATNGQSDKGFLLTLTFVPKELSALALGLYTCIKALNYIPGPRVR